MRYICLLFALLSVASAEPRQGRYVLLLSDPPVARQVAIHKNAMSAPVADRRQLLAQKQQSLIAELKRKGIPVFGSVQLIANAVFVAADENQVKMLKAMPGVRAVVRDIKLKRHLNKALDLMNVPAAWTALGGMQKAGTGVRIAVLDTGIDQTHAAFQDTSLTPPSGFPMCNADNGDCTFTNNKIIVARSYVSMLNFLGGDTNPAFTRPDDFSPRDHVGHGTAMAMIAAGVQNTSPAGIQITGVAPKAFLGNYKIFGSPGVNDTTYSSVFVAALNDAVSDGMDIATVALGAPALWDPATQGTICNSNAQPTDPCDWRAAAVQNAVNSGLVVVTSAGNDGNLAVNSPLASIHTPGTAPASITVGATTNAHIGNQTITVGGSGVPSTISSISTLFGNGPRPFTPLKAKIIDLSKTGDNGQACAPLAGNSLNGAIALIARGNCVFSTKVINAQNAGAVGVIIYQDQSNGIFEIVGLDTTSIPAALIGHDNGTALKTYVDSNSNATATLDPTFVLTDNTQNADFIAPFSSQGPSLASQAIKPELVATGSDLYVATQSYDPNSDMYDKSGYTVVQGTSYAAAMVAGAAALVIQFNGFGSNGFSQLTPSQIKSLLVNTTNTQVFDLDSSGNKVLASISAVGGGKLDAAAALTADVTAEPATLSFGVVGSNSTTARGIGVTLTNVGNNTLNLSLAVSRVDTDNNAQVVLSSTSVTLTPGQSTQITASVSGTPQAGSYSGDVVITGGAITEHIPFLYLVSDNTPYNILPVESFDWSMPVGGQMFTGFKVLDRYGIPVNNVGVKFAATQGGGTINTATATTDTLGIAEATVTVGPTVGDQEFTGATTDGSNLTAYFDGRARALPTIAASGVTDAATGLSGKGFAPGSYITIKGSNLSDSTAQVRTQNLPVSISGVSVSFDNPGANLSSPGHLSYVSPSQINVQVPWEFQGASSAYLKVSIGDYATSAGTTIDSTYPITIAQFNPGSFTFDPAYAGCQCAAALDENYGYVTSANPVARGHVVQLFLNGLGPVTNQPASGDPSPGNPLSQTSNMPTVTIGGVNAPVTFTGLAPGIVGLYQVNAQVASNTPTGVQPLAISVGGIASSQTINLPVK